MNEVRIPKKESTKNVEVGFMRKGKIFWGDRKRSVTQRDEEYSKFE